MAYTIRQEKTILITILKSKIHHAVVTHTDLQYEGSIVIDLELMEAANLTPYEKVLVVSNTSGARYETYVIPGKWGDGYIKLNGASTRLVEKGEQLIIMSFQVVYEPIKPTVVIVDKENKIKEVK